MNAITLPPELERFAEEAVAAGRFRDLSEVVSAGLSLLQQSDAELAAFVASLDEAKAESERLGLRSLHDVMPDIDTLIEDMAASDP